MKQQLGNVGFTALGVVVVAFVWASSVSAQEREMFMMSYPNANITVDGDASDWNLSEFGTYVFGGVNTEPFHPDEWERVTGTGDIARLGWDDANELLFYAGVYTGAALPEDAADNSVKFYARDNATHQYFLVDITDDEANTGDEAAWANDCVEFYIDPGDDGDPTDWSSDVQLVIDADNQVQVWNSPIDYEEQVEAGVVSAVTITETGWLLEVGIAKDVFDTALPAILGPANDPAGNNYGIDFSYRDNDDPDDTGTRNGDPAYTSDYVWADPFSGGGFPSKAAGSWGQMIAGVSMVVDGDFDNNGVLDALDIDDLTGQVASATNPPAYDLNADALVDSEDINVWIKDLKNSWVGDANLDGEFNSSDLVTVLAAGVYESDTNAVWSTGDFNGDGLANSSDLVAALADGGYEVGPRAATAVVPEPTGIMLLVLGCITVAWRRCPR